MATILMGWELGGGLGHVKTLLGVARELARHGHEPVFALRNIVEPMAMFRDESFPVLQAPFWHARAWRGPKPFVAATYADILAVRAYTDADDLWPMVEGWQRLIDLVRPKMIVCDHSPTLCLAAYGAVPTVLLGNGFTVPPADMPAFPLLLKNVQSVVPQEDLLAVVQSVQRRRGRPAPETLPGLLATAGRFIRTFPELDPYNSVRREPLIGPIGPLPGCSPVSGPPRFFAYLANDFPNLDKVVASLAESGIAGSAYVRDARQSLLDLGRKRGLEMFESPADLTELLPNVSVIVHHASLGMAEAALAAGRPQVLLPHHLEKQLIARSLGAMGVALNPAGRTPAMTVGQAVRQVILDRSYASRAMEWAATLHARGPLRGLSQIVDRCLTLLA